MTAVQACQSAANAFDLDLAVSDVALAYRAKCEPNAFAALYQRYADRVFRYCYRSLGIREAAEDATSLVFTKALAGIDRFDASRGTFASWLFAIANNVLADHFRIERRYQGSAEVGELIDPAQTPEEIALARDQAGALRSALKQLAPREREVIELRLAGLSSAEISDVLGCQRNSVAQAQFRALSRLRTLLGVAPSREGKRHV